MCYACRIGNVTLFEAIIGLLRHILHIAEVSGIGQFIEVDHAIMRILQHQTAHHVRADEAGAAGYEDIFIECHSEKSF